MVWNKILGSFGDARYNKKTQGVVLSAMPENIVLILVPNTQRRLSVLNCLSGGSYKMISVDTMRAAFLEGLNQEISLVISSDHLPDGSATELVHKLRVNGRKIPFIILAEEKTVASLDSFSSAVAVESVDITDPDVLAGLANRVERLISEMPQISIQRHFPRYYCNFDVYFETSRGGITSMSKGISLSGGGMFLATSVNLPAIGEFVAFKIPAQLNFNEEIEGIGIVRWKRERSNAQYPGGFAIEFVSMSLDTQRQVSELISRVSSAEIHKLESTT